MNARQNSTPPLATVYVSACILAICLAPLGYIGIGALASFAATFSFVSLPPLAAAMIYLLYRYGVAPGSHNSRGVGSIVANAAAWMIIISFLWVVSHYNLFKPLERFGVLGMIYLSSLAASFPFSWIRRRRLKHAAWLSSPTAYLVSTFTCLAAATVSFAYFLNSKSIY